MVETSYPGGLKLIKIEHVHMNYVLATWVKSVRDSFIKRGFNPEIVIRQERDASEMLSPLCHILTLPDAEETIHGWICGKPGLLHWAYVPPDLRRNHLFTTMCRSVCGEKPEYSRKPWKFKLPQDWAWNPWRIMEE